MVGRPRGPTLFPYTMLFRSQHGVATGGAIPPLEGARRVGRRQAGPRLEVETQADGERGAVRARQAAQRSEEHTSELQSHSELVCRPLLEKKNTHLELVRNGV